MPKAPRISQLTSQVGLDDIQAHIDRQGIGKREKLDAALSSAKDKLTEANKTVEAIKSIVEPFKLDKETFRKLLAPLKEVVTVLDVLSQIHPAVGATVTVVKLVVNVELTRRENNKQIAVLFVSMSSLLLLLAELDPIFDDDQPIHANLQAHLEEISKKVFEFGNFCHAYYLQKGLLRMIRADYYKGKLEEFVKSFAELSTKFHLLVSSQTAVHAQTSAVTILDVQVDVKAILSLLQKKSAKEQEAASLIAQAGGVEALLKDDKKLQEFATKVGEKFDASVKAKFEDIEDVMKDHAKTYMLKLENTKQDIQSSITLSAEEIKAKLDQGPHEFIEDQDIKQVWKDMHGRTSVKTRVFLNAVHDYFVRKSVQYDTSNGASDPNAWALHFLSKIIFYPAIGDALDEDSSGFISVKELNTFLHSQPRELKCTAPQWIAFWAIGPYQTDLEHLERINHMLEIMENVEVHESNRRRMDHLREYTKVIRLISVRNSNFSYLEDYGPDSEALDKVRITWRNAEMKWLQTRLEGLDYQIDQPDDVTVLLAGRRLEHAQPVAREEFDAMATAWESISDAFAERMDSLTQVWRQQKLDISLRMETFSGGLFERLYQLKSFIEDEELDDAANQIDDEDWDQGYDDYDSDEEEEEGEEDGEDAGSTESDEMPDILSFAALGLPPELGKSGKHDGLFFPEIEPSDPAQDVFEDVDFPEWEPPMIKKRKAEMELKERVERIESKIDSIGTMLQALLSSQAQATQHPSPPAAPRQETPNLGDALASIAAKPLQRFAGKIDQWLGPEADDALDLENEVDRDQHQTSAWDERDARSGSGAGQIGVGPQSDDEYDEVHGSYYQGGRNEYEEHGDSDEDQQPDSGYGRGHYSDSDGGHNSADGGDSNGGSSDGGFGLRNIRKLGLSWRR